MPAGGILKFKCWPDWKC